MGDIIDLAARRRQKEIESSICFVGEQRVDPIDEELNRQFVEAQRRELARLNDAKNYLQGICEALERIRDVCREAQKDGPPTTP